MFAIYTYVSVCVCINGVMNKKGDTYSVLFNSQNHSVFLPLKVGKDGGLKAGKHNGNL